MKRGFKKRAEEKSIQLRAKIGGEIEKPLNIKGLCDYMEIKVIPLSHYQKIGFLTGDEINQFKPRKEGYKEFSATLLINKETQKVIVFNDFHSYVRQNSSIAHEIAHIICKHNFLSNFGNIFGLHQDYDKEQEDEANWMAGCLLLPRKSLVWAVERNMKVNEIASFFQVSIPMARWRYNMTGVARVA